MLRWLLWAVCMALPAQASERDGELLMTKMLAKIYLALSSPGKKFTFSENDVQMSAKKSRQKKQPYFLSRAEIVAYHRAKFAEQQRLRFLNGQ